MRVIEAKIQFNLVHLGEPEKIDDAEKAARLLEILREGSLEAMRAAYDSGLVFRGDIDIPVIDWRHYLEHDNEGRGPKPSGSSTGWRSVMIPALQLSSRR